MAAKTYLFLDEKGADAQNFYFLGGIALAADRLQEVADWVREFKKTVHPSLDPDSWYLKGSGESVFQGVKQEDSRAEAFRRWELWADHIEKLRSAYRIHATLVLPHKLLARLDNKLTDRKDRRAAVLKMGMFATLLSLAPHERGSVSLWIDHVEGTQKDALQWGTSLVQGLARDRGLSLIIESVNVVPKKDTSSNESQILQFVDMHIYALSRFILPPSEEGFILADFEQLPYASTAREMPSFLLGEGEKAPEVLVNRYYKIGSLYHHIRHRISKNVFVGPGKPMSSIVLVGGAVHSNFGGDVDRAIWKFCNPMWEGWDKKQLLIDFEAYE